jgi:cell division protease FtsH
MPVEKDGDRSHKSINQAKSLGSSIGSLLAFWLILNFLILPAIFRPKRVPYSEFLEQVRNGQVAEALVSEAEIRYKLKPSAGHADSSSSDQTSSAANDASSTDNVGQTNQSEAQLNRATDAEDRADQVYSTVPVEIDSGLVDLLVQHNVEFGSPSPNQGSLMRNILGWVLPPVIFVAIWAWFMRRMQASQGNALTVGKSKARIYSEGDTGVSFHDVAGADEAKAELIEIVEFLKHADRYTQIGAVIPKGVLLVGPPGTGKTLLAKAVAGEAGVPFFSISGSEFIELFVGVGAARVRDLFEQAKQKAPCIVFIDELDALGKARNTGGSGFPGRNDEQEQTLNQLLTEMDGFEGNTGVVILAATNRPEVLDVALRRPGRFDRQVLVDRPDKAGRAAILRVHAKKIKLGDDLDFDSLAARTSGFAGADLANLVNEAALLAARAGQTMVSMANFAEAFESVVAGLERKSRVLNPEEKKIVAYHEVGHALVGTLMPGANKVEKISIIPRGSGALGYTLQLPEEDRFLMAEDEIRGRIATLLGGRSAEEIVFGKVSTGASDDIQKATDLAERMITIYGMDPELGPIAFERLQQQYLNGGMSARRAVGVEVAGQIDRDVKLTIDAAHAAAQQILAENRELLEAAAQHLLQKEVLEGPELYAYLEQVKAPANLQAWLAIGQWSNHDSVVT